MLTQFDVPGLPDGTITIPQPATCPELADTYVAPSCAFPHDLVYIPMDITFLPETGAEFLWWLIPVAWVILAVGGALLIGAFIRAGRRGHDS
jgi:hypothetical protein